MSSLIGCPLNGTWTIYVCDHLSSDNGWIFEWGLYFAADLYPNDTWSFTNTYPSNGSGYSWSGVGMATGQNGSADATAVVQNPDQNNWSLIPYTFSATDNFGCTYDTTITVHVKPAHHADCCIEPTPSVTVTSNGGVTTCNPSATPVSTSPCGNAATLSAGSFAYPQNTGEWTYTGPGTANFTAPTQPITDVTVNVYGEYTFTWHEYYMGNETCSGEASVTVNFAREMNATLSQVDNFCRSGSPIQLSAQDFGTLTCSPASEALNLDARTFSPSLANPGRYTITNTISGERCACPATSSVSFEIYDEIVISNRTEVCQGGNMVNVTFNVNGLTPGSNPPQYQVWGPYTEYEDGEYGTPHLDSILRTNNYESGSTYSFSRPSALEYALTVRDAHGCSSVGVAGYFACECPFHAGAFADYNPHILCTGDTYNVSDTTVGHNGHQVLGDPLLGGIFSYIICTNPNDISNSWVATLPGTTATISLGTFNGRNNVQYYIVAVAGRGEGLNAWGNGCRSVTQAVPLMWKERPVPTVVGGETCGLVIQLNGSAVPDGMNGYWTATPPEGVTNYSYTTIENTTNIMNNPRVLSSHYGRVTYTWHLVNAECDGSASAVYNFRQIPSPEAGPDITVCGVTAEITGANPTIPAIEGSSLQWTGSGVIMTPANSIQPTANANGSGTYVLTLTERNGECAGSDNVTVTFINVPAPATTANVDTVCGHTAELQVYNTNPANEGRWTAYDMNGNRLPTVVYHNYNSPQSASRDDYPHCFVTVPIPDDQTEVEYVFKWAEPISDPRIDDPSCIGQAEKHIVFRKVPVVSVHQCGATGNHVSVCGNTVELCADATASEGYSSYMWMCKGIAGTFADSSQTSTTFTLDTSIHVTRYSDIDIYFVARNASCISIDTMHVTFLQKPTAYAGKDRSVCGDTCNLNGVWDLRPADDYTPLGRWWVDQSSMPDPYAQVRWLTGSQDSVAESVRVSDYGIYTFYFREINNMGLAGTCFDTDTVRIEFMEIPNARAGRDTSVCGLDFQLNAISSHQEGDSIVGTWTASSGGAATFADRHDPHTTGHYSAYGSATFRWTETNHPHLQVDENEHTCSDDDEVTVTFYEVPSPVINMNEGDTAVCGWETTGAYLRAEYPGDGIQGHWWDPVSGTHFGPNDETINSIYTDASVASYGVHNFYWIEFNGPNNICSDTAGPWPVRFIENPVADIVPDELTFCGLDGGPIPVNFNGVGNGRWSSNAASSTLTFDDRSNPDTEIHSAIYTAGNSHTPYFELYWTVLNTQLCTSSDTIKVVFAMVPSSDVTIIPPKCFGGPAIITAVEDTLATYNWELGNGNIDTVYTNQADGEYRTFVYWNDKQDEHIVGLTTMNSWGCESYITRDTVFEPRRPEYTYNIIGDTCGLGRGGIEFIDTLRTYSFFWIDTTVGPAITNPVTGTPITDLHVYNLPAGTYTYRTEYQTFNNGYLTQYNQFFGDINCYDYPMVEVGTIGMIEAEFAVSADVILSSLVAPDAEVTFVNSTNYDNVGKKCEWHFGDGVVEKNCDELVQHTYTEPGCYEPYLIVMNRDLQECRDTAFLDECVFVDKASSLDIPNIFSPNGDGINDYFQVKAQTLKTFHGKILNRYGRVVFEWTDWENEDAGWDGRLNGSTKATPGVYFYIIEAEGYDGNPYNEEGPLHLVR